MAGVNVKDGLVRLLKMDSITRGISVTLNRNKLILDFHVIVAYPKHSTATLPAYWAITSLPTTIFPMWVFIDEPFISISLPFRSNPADHSAAY